MRLWLYYTVSHSGCCPAEAQHAPSREVEVDPPHLLPGVCLKPGGLILHGGVSTQGSLRDT